MFLVQFIFEMALTNWVSRKLFIFIIISQLNKVKLLILNMVASAMEYGLNIHTVHYILQDSTNVSDRSLCFLKTQKTEMHSLAFLSFKDKFSNKKPELSFQKIAQ